MSAKLLTFADVVRRHVPPEELAVAKLRECCEEMARAFSRCDKLLHEVEAILSDRRTAAGKGAS